MAADTLSRAAGRPWYVDTGWDGGLTAIVSFEGHLVAECEPERAEPVHPEYRGGLRGESEANARLICEAVNAHRTLPDSPVPGDDPTPWLDQAAQDWLAGSFRPSEHYVLLFRGAAAEIRKLRAALEVATRA